MVIRSYIQIVEDSRQHSGARLDRLTPAQLRRYHLYLLEERRLAAVASPLHQEVTAA